MNSWSSKQLKKSFLFVFCFIFWPSHTTCRILVPQPRIKATPSAVKAWSSNHWTTREFPQLSHLKVTNSYLSFLVNECSLLHKENRQAIRLEFPTFFLSQIQIILTFVPLGPREELILCTRCLFPSLVLQKFLLSINSYSYCISFQFPTSLPFTITLSTTVVFTSCLHFLPLHLLLNLLLLGFCSHQSIKISVTNKLQ